MAFKYGDAVVLVQKSPAGIRRVNAIVLASATQPPNATRPTGLKDFKGALMEEGEYLDLAIPRAFPEGQEPKTRDMSTIFQPTYATPPWKEGATIGWQPGSATAVAPEPAPAQPEDEAPAPKKNSRWGK